MAITKPEKMNFSNNNIIMLISGLPGVGKTTVALSAPDVLLIDADEGLSRVNPAHRRDASICKNYDEVLADIEAAKGNYKTIVIDTCGALIDMMKDWVTKGGKNCKSDGKTISLQGYGLVKAEFVRLSAELRKNFNVVFLFHETKTKDGDDTFYDIVCEGATKTLVWQPCSLGAHMFIMNGKRMLGFTPTAAYNAKSAFGIKGLVEVPELAEGDKNDFLAKIFETVRNNLNAETASLNEEQQKYAKLMETGKAMIADLNTPEQVPEILATIKDMPKALTSEKEITAMLKARMAELNIKYDKTKKVYYVEG